MDRWSWGRLVEAHHDFHPRATRELERRLRGEVRRLSGLPGPGSPATPLSEELRAWAMVEHALVAEIQAWDGVADLFTGRVLSPLLDWERLRALDQPEGAVERDRWLRRVRVQVLDRIAQADPGDPLAARLRGPRRDRWRTFGPVEADTHEDERTPLDPRVQEALTHGAIQELSTDPSRVARRACLVLVAFNRDGAPRVALEALADRLGAASSGPDDPGVDARRALRHLEAAIQDDPALAAEHADLVAAMFRIARLAHGEPVLAPPSPKPELTEGGGIHGWPWILSPKPAPGVARASTVPAVWLLQSLLQSFRADDYRPSAAGQYGPRNLGRDTWSILRSWGYPKRIHVTLSEEPAATDFGRLTQGVRGALSVDPPNRSRIRPG